MSYIKYFAFFLLVASRLHVKAQSPPEPPIIKSVTVVNEKQVKIEWTPSITPGVTGYILYKFSCQSGNCNYREYNTNIGSGVVEFIDLEAHANEMSESYKIAAYIGNKSNYGTPSKAHGTMFLQPVIYDSCSLSFKIKWGLYKGWENNFSEYIVYRRLSGGADVPLITINNANDTIFTDKVMNKNDIYQYYIEVHDLGANVSRSNIIKQVANVPLAPNPNDFKINQVSYNESQVNITLGVPNYTSILKYNLMRSAEASGTYKNISTKKSEGNQNYHYSDTQSVEQPLFYKAIGIDVCQEPVVESNIIQPIVLQVKKAESDLTFTWNHSFTNLNEDYTIYYSVDECDYKPLGSATDCEFHENINNIEKGAGESFCFYVESLTNVESFKSRSNTVCVTKLPIITLPTAFTPNGDGLNDCLGPFWVPGKTEHDIETGKGYIFNVALTEFKFIIYDKYGGNVFDTDAWDNKWSGDIRNTKVSEGAYLYYMWFKTITGKEYEQSGAINVLFP